MENDLSTAKFSSAEKLSSIDWLIALKLFKWLDAFWNHVQYLSQTSWLVGYYYTTTLDSSREIEEEEAQLPKKEKEEEEERKRKANIRSEAVAIVAVL